MYARRVHQCHRRTISVCESHRIGASPSPSPSLSPRTQTTHPSTHRANEINAYLFHSVDTRRCRDVAMSLSRNRRVARRHQRKHTHTHRRHRCDIVATRNLSADSGRDSVIHLERLRLNCILRPPLCAQHTTIMCGMLTTVTSLLYRTRYYRYDVLELCALLCAVRCDGDGGGVKTGAHRKVRCGYSCDIVDILMSS